jgi:DnaA-homolog protein
VIPQLPLGLRFTHAPSFDGFIGSADVLLALQNAARCQSRESFYLEGPVGSGKTHLLLASSALVRAYEKQATYLPLSVLAGRLAEALSQQEQADFICIDGLDFIAGNHEAEVALFHFHNRLQDAGKTLLYAARTPPLGLNLVLPDLQSRFGQCTRLNIEALDDDGRRKVLLHRADQRGLEVDDAVLDFMFKRVGRDLLSLTTLLDKLDRESLAAQRKITVPFLRKVIESIK